MFNNNIKQFFTQAKVFVMYKNYFLDAALLVNWYPTNKPIKHSEKKLQRAQTSFQSPYIKSPKLQVPI